MSFEFVGPYSCNRDDFDKGWNDVLCYTTPGSYTIRCKDSYGDGWHGGYVNILGVDYCKGLWCNGRKCNDGKLATGGPITITYDSGTVIHGTYVFKFNIILLHFC